MSAVETFGRWCDRQATRTAADIHRLVDLPDLNREDVGHLLRLRGEHALWIQLAAEIRTYLATPTVIDEPGEVLPW